MHLFDVAGDRAKSEMEMGFAILGNENAAGRVFISSNWERQRPPELRPAAVRLYRFWGRLLRHAEGVLQFLDRLVLLA